MWYARKSEGRVVEVIEPLVIDGQEVPIEERFTAELVAQLVEYDPENPPEDPPAPPLSVEQRIKRLVEAVDAHLDVPAVAKGYDNIKSAALRAAYAGPFHDEGVAFATWMDACYAQCYALLAQWQAGQLVEPTPEELIAMLPALELP